MGKTFGHLKIVGIVLAAVLALAGCSTTKTLFVIMPEADGRVGRVEVATGKGSQVLDRPWQAVETTGIDRPPGEPKPLDEQTVRAMFREALDARPDPPKPYRIRFVIMPEADGRVGRVEVATEKGAQILDRPWQATEMTRIDRLPGEPKTLDEGTVRAIFKEALDARPDPPVTYRVFFPTGRIEMTTASGRTIQEVLETIKARNPHEITISGHTDTVGPASYNRTLSLNRARAVADLLVLRGVKREIIEITYHGKENPFIPTPDGVAEPRNRRVEITIR